MLNGSLEYIISGVVASQINDVNVFGANFGTNTNILVTVEVLNSAETASLFLSGNTAGSPGALLSSVTFEIRVVKGVQVIQFISGTALSSVVPAINTFTPDFPYETGQK